MQISPSGTPAGQTGIHDAQEASVLEFLVFSLGAEEYALSIRKVQELRGYDAVTHIANAPDYVKGVINLRGLIVPIIDMRIKFNLGTPTYDASTVVVVINLAERVVGMVVDGVSDVVALAPEQIKAAPRMDAATLDTGYLIGMGTLDDRMLILVDIDKLMAGSELGMLPAAS